MLAAFAVEVLDVLLIGHPGETNLLLKQSALDLAVSGNREVMRMPWFMQDEVLVSR